MEVGAGGFDKKGDNLPWVEKYRPKRLEDLIAQDDKISTISRLIDAGKMPHLLLYGPPGTGKTSTILACARKLNGNNFGSMVLELNASDDRGISVVRQQIKNFASSRQLFKKGIKLIILDECDSMTRDTQFALRRVIEKYTAHTRFCLICNYINKITPALQSRCTRFRFGPLSRDQVLDRVQDIADKEGVNLTKDGLKAIVDLAEGDMRKCLNVLQACHLAYKKVDEETVYLSTGNPPPKDIETILNALLDEKFADVYKSTAKLMRENGYALSDVLRLIHDKVIRIKLPAKSLMFLLDKMSNIEFNLSAGAKDKTQLSALVGAFSIAKNMAVEAKSS
uniref:AAA+ ATPase domain-containing protein n=1 Tax=Lotharella oceanica TaxID=641309 RepID=A0A7S2XA06_9EUKA